MPSRQKKKGGLGDVKGGIKILIQEKSRKKAIQAKKQRDKMEWREARCMKAKGE